jgi:hypothetical protein
MDTVTISDPEDRRFPFTRLIFEDPHVLYHGTWSTYSSKIELKGFACEYPVPWPHIATIVRALDAIGGGSFASGFLGDKLPTTERPDGALSLSCNFWLSRAYAIDGGGEIVRTTIRDALNFESICTTSEKRAALISRRREGLRTCPGHTATANALRVLTDDSALKKLCAEVAEARAALQDLTNGGCPVVYAVRVKREWFGEMWDRHSSFLDIRIRSCELTCRRDLISPGRIVAKVIYPNGTFRNFMPPNLVT